MAVVREDVAKISFDIEHDELLRLTNALDDIKKMLTGGIGDDAFDEMIKESKRATDGVEDVKDSLKGIKPDGLNETVDSLKDTGEKADDAHDKLKKIANMSFSKTLSGLGKLGSTLGSLTLKAGKLLAGGIAAGAAGVGAIVGQSVAEFADYEQLSGGVDTLFKDSADAVKNNASDAFKTAGLSANDYMDTVTSFSASLIQSLGGDTEKAADKAHTAIVDMSDNANKMGTDMESIQYAYQGFAKQNYTMLDNLKLGYGGTKEEMERLIKDAEKLSGKDLDISSYADVVDAIHIIQEEMGIAGTTAKEANETISGSFSSLKAAWSNTLVSLVRGGDDFDKCVDNLVESAKTFGKNIMPAIIKSLDGVGTLIEELAPIIEKELPTIVDTLLPPLLNAATALIKGLIAALPGIISVLVEELPGLLKQIWVAVEDILGDQFPGLKKVDDFFGGIYDFCQKNADTVKKLAPAVIGLIAAFKLLSKLKSFGGLFGGGSGGKSGGGLFSGLSGLANLKPTTVLKGIGNLAIIIGGLVILGAAVALVAPYIAKLSDLQSLAEVFLIVAALGVSGTVLAKSAATLGNLNVTKVALGLANMAIVLTGLTVLAAAFAFAAPYIAELSDMKSILEVIAIVSILGIVGSVLTVFAGIAGIIPTTLVLKGLANIALVIGGLSALVLAFGALGKIPGFNEFISTGGDTLANLFEQIGKIAGSLIGGFGEGLTDSLPAIGENLSAFAESLKPMFDTFANADMSGIGEFITALGKFVAVAAGEEFLSFITGGPDYADLGLQLSAFAENATGFFTTVATLPKNGFTNAKLLFQSLADIGNVPNSGGIAQWFSGTNDFSGLATGLKSLSGEGVVKFFKTVAQMPEEGFTKAKDFFKSLSDIGNIPNSGGLAQWFGGENDYEGLATGLKTLGPGVKKFYESIAMVDDFGKFSECFKALGEVKVPKEGGLFGMGEETVDLTDFGKSLKGFASNSKGFFTMVSKAKPKNITAVFDAIKKAESLASADLSGFAGKGTTLSNFMTNVKGFFTGASEIAGNIASVNAVANALQTFFTTVNGIVVTSLGSVNGNLTTTMVLVAGATVVFGDLGESIIQCGTDGVQGMMLLVTAVKAGMTAVENTVQAVDLYDDGQDIMRGLNNGMLSKLPMLIATATAMATAIKTAFDNAMGIDSPATEMIARGEFTGEGQAIGMENSLPRIREASDKMAYASMPFDTYSPDSGSYYNTGGNTEYTTISPVFNLTISGTQDDRATARKVKRYVNEAIRETFASMERKSSPIREV